MNTENQKVVIRSICTKEFNVAQLRNINTFSVSVSPIVGVKHKKDTVEVELGEEKIYKIYFNQDYGVDVKELCEGMEGIVKLIRKEYKIEV